MILNNFNYNNKMSSTQDKEVIRKRIKKKKPNHVLVNTVQPGRVVGLSFNLMSEDQIKHESRKEIKNKKDLYSERLGTIENRKRCAICGNNNMDCTGHFGHMDFKYSMIHPLYGKKLLDILKSWCWDCHRIRVHKSMIRYMKKYPDKDGNIYRTISKIPRCHHKDCGAIQPKVKDDIKKNTIYIEYPNDQIYKSKKIVKKVTLTVNLNKLKKDLKTITNEELELLGIDYRSFRPEDCVIRRIPICPVSTRPYIVQGNKICDDDITYSYQQIIQNETLLQKGYRMRKSDDEITRLGNLEIKKLTSEEYFAWIHLIDNSGGEAHKYNNKTTLGVKERIDKKAGVINKNLAGNRCNYGFRNVIGPSPHIKLGEAIIPREIADKLPFYVRINQLNIKEMQQMVDNKEIEFMRDNSGHLIKLSASGINYKCKLSIGNVIERNLQNGDYVVLNRQPTLRKESIMAHRILIIDDPSIKNIQIHLSATPPYNADFDGDEMSGHIPLSLISKVEMELLMSLESNIISNQSNKSIVKFVQDGVLGLYVLSKNTVRVDPDLFYNILCRTELINKNICDKPCNNLRDKFNSFKQHKKELGLTDDFIKFYSNGKLEHASGRAILSFLFPNDFKYEYNDVKIKYGILYSGIIDKKHSGDGHNKLIQCMAAEYGNLTAYNFISLGVFVCHSWFQENNFSIGIDDCIIDGNKEIKNIIEKGKLQIAKIQHSKMDPDEKESEICMATGDIKNNVQEYILKHIDKDNNLYRLIKSGAKGNMENLCQIIGCVGQNTIMGKRIGKILGGRTLPYFTKEETSLESRGFIASSYNEGLNLVEFIIHMAAGIEGMVNVTTGTPETGYNNIKLCKLMEEIMVQYDGSVRISDEKNIIQFIYGVLGLDPSKCRLVNGSPFFIDIKREADKLNSIYGCNPDNKTKLTEHMINEIVSNVRYGSKIKIDGREINVLGFLPNRIRDSINAVLRNILKRDLECVELVDADNKYKEFSDRITKKFIESMVSPGEMVGISSGNSLSEVSTQGALDFKHYAGKSEKNVSVSVNRTKELLECSVFVKILDFTIKLKKNSVITKKDKYMKTMLRDVILKYEPYGSKDQSSVTNDTLGWWEDYQCDINDIILTKRKIVLDIDMVELYRIDLTLLDLANILRNNSIKCVHSPIDIHKIVIYTNDISINLEVVNEMEEINEILRLENKKGGVTFIDNYINDDILDLNITKLDYVDYSSYDDSEAQGKLKLTIYKNEKHKYFKRMIKNYIL